MLGSIAQMGVTETSTQRGEFQPKTGGLTPLSLDLKRRDNIIGAMSSLRTSIVAVIALAIAAFPVAGASARGVAPDAVPVAVEADCENHAQTMAPAANHQVTSHQAKADGGQGHCDKSAGCGKCLCLGLTAVLTTASDAHFSPMLVVKTARVADSAVSPAYIPPSPPPRL